MEISVDELVPSDTRDIGIQCCLENRFMVTTTIFLHKGLAIFMHTVRTIFEETLKTVGNKSCYVDACC